MIGIVANDYTPVVRYEYNSWGKTINTSGSHSETLGELNPFRYRGYVYDEETGFYYLQSRYYDTETCRFLNADGYVTTGQGILGNNMFAYCGNNPVNYVDPFGTSAFNAIIKRIIFAFETVKTYVQLSKIGFNNVSIISAADCVKTMKKNGIDSAEEKAHFFAQCYVEGNSSLLEAGYLSEEKAEAYRKKQPYYPYYGAGYIQLTWDYNYKTFSEYIGDPLIYELGPKYVATNYAWSATGWFWSVNGINAVVANGGSVKAVTRIVNGGYNHLQERIEAYNKFITIFK